MSDDEVFDSDQEGGLEEMMDMDMEAGGRRSKGGKREKGGEDSDEDSLPITITHMDGKKAVLRFPEAAVPDVIGASNSKKKKSKSGGFQSMGLNPELMKAILKVGYTVPTPIQRKTIPIALAGNDIVAMARTGSGKTAAFLIPVMQALRAHSTKVGARALILAPTRELATQSFKAALLLCKYSDLRLCLLVGGERLETQFGLLAQNPDIIIATPGRLMHHIAEIDMTLRSVEMLIFDEADRLFEMGFAPQLHEIMKAMSDKRQTLLFSATLPGVLADFARAGLHNPVMLRLDVESKLSEQLQMAFLASRAHDKAAMLLYLLLEVIPPGQKSVVFAATKHHVEFYHAILRAAGIYVTAVYGTMDQSARKINIAKFRASKVDVMIVTDVAARGIDIPLLDNVINCDFPATPKLFVHRVGRVARAGRSGKAFSLVGSDEVAYMVDLNLFLGRNVETYTPPADGAASGAFDHAFDQAYYGCLPQDLLDVQAEWVKAQISASAEFQQLERAMKNAYKLYHRTRPPPSPESVRRAKSLPVPPLHPIILNDVDQEKHDYLDYLKGIKNFRPSQTIFEAKMTTQGGISVAAEVMSKKRAFHSHVISKQQAKLSHPSVSSSSSSSSSSSAHTPSSDIPDTLKDEEEEGEGDTSPFARPSSPIEGGEAEKDDPESRIQSSSSSSSSSSSFASASKNNNNKIKKRKRSSNFVDDQYFLSSFHSSNSFAERGLAVKEHGITREAEFGVGPDEAVEEQKQKRQFRWDRKDKKYKKYTKENKIKVEKKFYKEWTKTTHARVQKEGEQEVPYRVSNAQKQLGLSDTLDEVNKQVHTSFKNKQLKPAQFVKASKMKAWKQKSKQEARRSENLHKRQQNAKKGNVSKKSQHKFRASSMSKSR